MKKQGFLWAVAVSGWLAGRGLGFGMDPVASQAGFGDFQQVDIQRLLDGEILSERGALMNFPSGITTQTCFAVPKPAEETARRLQVWDPSPHKELKVYAFRPLHIPCETADFKDLKITPGPRSIGWMLDRTLTTTADKSELNLSRN